MTEALATYKALADPTRLRILRTLAAGPFHVNELVAILDAGQSTVSRHLRLLAEAGLVSCRRTRTWAYYSLAKDGKRFPAGQIAALEADWNGGPNPDQEAIDAVLIRRRESTAAFFRKSATHWDRLRDDLLGPSTHLGRVAEIVSGTDTVVDLGTGTGVLLERLAPKAGRVIGVDASPEMLEIARHRVHAAALENTELRLGSLEHLPLSDGEADAMIANLVLHHVAEIGPVLREIRRGLAPGGRVVIVELTDTADEAFWQALGAQWPGFRPDDLCTALEEAGFASPRIEDLGLVRTNGHAPVASSARPNVFLIEAVSQPGPQHRGRSAHREGDLS